MNLKYCKGLSKIRETRINKYRVLCQYCEKKCISELLLCLFNPLKSDQRAKKVVSDIPGLVDFGFGVVIFVLNLPDRQVLFFWEIQITERLQSILLSKKGLGAS